MTWCSRASPLHVRLAILAVFLAMICACEKMHDSFRSGKNPEGIGRAIDNIRLPNGETGSITGSLAPSPEMTGGPYVVHIEGFRGTAIVAGAGESFTLENVPVGERRILVYERTQTDGLQLTAGTTFSVRSEPVTVHSEEISDAGALTLKPSGAIHGSVEGNSGVESFAYIPGSWFVARVDRDGSYTLEGVPEGRYRIAVTSAGSLNAYSVQIKVVSGAMVDAPPVTIDRPFVIPGAIALDEAAEYARSRTVSIDFSQDAAVSMIMLSEDPKFTNVGWQDIPETVEYIFATDGPHRLYAKFKISNEYVTTPVTDDIYVDTLPPTGTLAMQDGTGYTTVRDVLLAISGEDISGVSEMILSEDATFTGASWEAYAPSRMFTLSEGDGTKTVYMKLKDSGEHISELISTDIGYETRAPEPPVISVAQGLYTPTRNITIKVASSASVAPLRWALFSESSDFTGASWQDFAAEMPYTISAGEGPKTIYARFKDSAGEGNESDVVSTTTTLDLTLPTTPAISNTPRRVDATTEPIVITTPSTDTFFKSYVVRGGAYKDWTEVTPPITFTMPDNDTWYGLEVRGKDLAGNMSESAAVRLFRGSQTILDGSAAQLTGETSRSATSDQATLSYLYTPYLLRNAGVIPSFIDYNLLIEAGAELRVTAGLALSLTNLTIEGTSARHVTLTSANSSKLAGDWRTLSLYGAVSIDYLDVAYNSYTLINKGVSSATISNSTFTNFSSYGIGDTSSGTVNISHTSIYCLSSDSQTGYSANGTLASTRTLSYMEVEHCNMGITISGTPSVTMTNSKIVNNPTGNVYITSSSTGTILFTGDYFGYSGSNPTIANFNITFSGKFPLRFTWSDCASPVVGTTGPLP